MAQLNLPGLTTEYAISTLRGFRALGEMESRFATHVRTMSHMGVGLSFAVSIPLQIAITAVSKTFTDFEDQVIRTTNRISGATVQTTKDLMKFATDLSRQIPQSAREIEEAVDNITRMGGNLNFAKEATPMFAKFATVLGMDVTEATEETMRTFQALGMVTGDLHADLDGLDTLMTRMIQTFEVTGFKNHQMIEAFQNSAGIAQSYGMNVNELTMSLMMMSRASKEGREASTSLAIVLRALTGAQGRHKQEFGKLFGSDLTENWNHLPWMARLSKVQEVMSKLKGPAQEAAWKSIGIQGRQVSQINPFLEHLVDLPEFQRKMKEQEVIQDRFNKIMAGTKAQLQVLWNNFVAVGLAIGEIVLPPLLKFGNILVGIIGAIARFVTALGNIPFGLGALATFMGKFTVFVTLIGLAAAGPLLLIGSWFGRLVMWAEGGIGSIVGLTQAFKTLFLLVQAKGIGGAVAKGLGMLFHSAELGLGSGNAFGDFLRQKRLDLGKFGGPRTFGGIYNVLNRGTGPMALESWLGEKIRHAGVMIGPVMNRTGTMPLSGRRDFRYAVGAGLTGIGDLLNAGVLNRRVSFSSLFTGIRDAWKSINWKSLQEIFKNTFADILNYLKIFPQMLLSAFNMIKGFTWAGLVSGIKAVFTAIFTFSLPLWGAVALGIMAVVGALVFLSKKSKSTAEELQQIAHPTYIENAGGGIKELRLPGDIGTSGPYGREKIMESLRAEHDSIFSIAGATEYYSDDKKKEVMGMRSKLSDMMKTGEDIDVFTETFEQALKQGDLLKEEQDKIRTRIETAGKSGLTRIPGNDEGEDDFEGGDKKNARPVRYFSAKSLGTAEEYRARIMGQQALVHVADSNLAVAKMTAKSSEKTAHHTQNIDTKTVALKPANL